MPPYRQLGTIARKRHIAFPQAGGGFRGEGIHYEEVVTTAGFSRAYSILYHLRPPTRVRRVEPAGSLPVPVVEEPVLRHHHLKTGGLPPAGDPITGRVPLLTNADVTLWRCRPAQPQAELYRNAIADEVLFIHRGRGTLETMFGRLPFKPFDYIVIPRCTTYRLVADPEVSLEMLIIESAGSIVVPPKYLNPDGQMKLGAPFCERDLHGPAELITVVEETETPVMVKDGPRLTRYVLAQHPFDVVGWDGLVYPYTFNADDFEPLTGTVHLPPPVHQTFEAAGFVICTFAPRMLDTHPEAIKVPYAHSNVQADEVLYYVRGRFGSRRGVEEASITLHPRGIPHGPHPGTIVASRSMARTDELAVMVDTERPLQLTRQALELDDAAYPYSWLE
ncbi:MAG: homogentisate 1,2-dioxygenase [Gemmataceae bacterium]|nr:homogentisate 1,2-dioxygenase [Gemmataceae bacterium]MDW8264962.1 homogentisate 1,2-dioxygenase domain-containing protein [Gemmataceae bacterium]